MTEFITRNYGQKEFEVIIKTDSKDHYKQAEEFSRKLIDHAKPQTNADRIRSMNDEELRNWLFNRDCANIAAFFEPCGMGVMDAAQLLKWLQNPAEGE